MSSNSDLYKERIDGVRELKLQDFSVNSIMQVVVKHPDYAGKNGLIMFYSPTCPHCYSSETKKLWSDLAMTFGTVFPIGAVNCKDSNGGGPALQKYANVAGYPTIKLVHKDGTLETYPGPRTMKDLKKYICARTGNCK